MAGEATFESTIKSQAQNSSNLNVYYSVLPTGYKLNGHHLWAHSISIFIGGKRKEVSLEFFHSTKGEESWLQEVEDREQQLSCHCC